MAITISYTELPATVSLAENQVNVTVASSIVGKTNLYAHLHLMLWNGTAWAESGLEDAVPVVGGVAKFDISAYLRGYVTPKFTYPEHFTNIAIAQPAMVAKYRLKAWETYKDTDGSLVDKKTADSLIYDATFYVAPGSISQDDEATLNTLSTTWWDEWTAQQRFQNWMPGAKTTTVKAVEKLYWIARRTAEETITIDWIGTDGTTGTATETVDMVAYTMYEICTSSDLIAQLATKAVASYTVTITGQSETVSYVVDGEVWETEEFFIFRNSFGCYETLWCKGDRQGELVITRLQYENNLAAKYKHTDRRLGSVTLETARTRKTNTGYFEDREWMTWALLLIAGDDAWQYGENTLTPIVATTEKHKYIDDAEDIYTIEFEWKYSRNGRFGGTLCLAVENILPPYWNKVAAFFYRIDAGALTDAVNGLTAPVSANNITWPEIAGSDVLDFSDATFWDHTLLAWYNAAAPRTSPLSALVGGDWAEAATAATHARLFHKDYASKLRDVLPVVVYGQNLTTAQQLVVVNWLDWYRSIVYNSALLIDLNSKTIIEN